MGTVRIRAIAAIAGITLASTTAATTSSAPAAARPVTRWPAVFVSSRLPPMLLRDTMSRIRRLEASGFDGGFGAASGAACRAGSSFLACRGPVRSASAPPRGRAGARGRCGAPPGSPVAPAEQRMAGDEGPPGAAEAFDAPGPGRVARRGHGMLEGRGARAAPPSGAAPGPRRRPPVSGARLEAPAAGKLKVSKGTVGKWSPDRERCRIPRVDRGLRRGRNQG